MTAPNALNGEWLADQVALRLGAALPLALAAIDTDYGLAGELGVDAIHVGVMEEGHQYPRVEVVVPDVDEENPDVTGLVADAMAPVFVLAHVDHPERDHLYRKAWRMNAAIRQCLVSPGACGEGTRWERSRMSVAMTPDPRTADDIVSVGLVAINVMWTAPVGRGIDY